MPTGSTPDLAQLLKNHREVIFSIAAKHGTFNVRVFRKTEIASLLIESAMT